MRWQLGWMAVLILAGVITWTCRSAAQNATARSTDVAGGATNPPKNQSLDVAVVFEDSAADLPQPAIRDAIARELGMPPDHTVLAARRELEIGVDGRDLVVRFDSPDGSAERRVAMPSDVADTPELLRLIAGNLARDPRALVEPASHPGPATTAPVSSRGSSATSTDPTSADAKPRFRRHWFGLDLAQDFLYDPRTFVCDYGAQGSTYSCYFNGTSEPYYPYPNTSVRSVQSGFTVATTRLLASYDYALAPNFTVGGRAGVAFGGGPRGFALESSVKGTAFFPVHLEARAAWWFAPLTNQRVRAFLGASGGMLQIDSNPDYVVTCPDATTPGGDECGTISPPPTAPPVSVDVWRKVGRGFGALRAGAEVRLWDELGVELALSAIATFPAFGFALEPSLGVVYGL